MNNKTKEETLNGEILSEENCKSALDERMDNLVNKTRQKLIAEHGENKDVVENGMKIKRINPYLNAFDRFYKILLEFSKNLGIDLTDYQTQLSYLFEYCGDCESDEVNTMSAVLEHKNAILKPSKITYYKKKLKAFMEDIAQVSAQNNSSLARIGVAFSNIFGTTFSPSGEYARTKYRRVVSNYFKRF